MTTPSPHAEPTPEDAAFEPIQAKRKSDEHFRLAARAGKMFVYEWDAATGVGVLTGECAHVLGVDEGTHFIGEQILSKIHSDDRERLTTALTGLTPEKPCAQVSHRIVHPDRGVIWVETSSRASFDGAGRTLRIMGRVADITERKLAETELAIAEDRLHLAMQAGKSVAWEWDVASGRDSRFGDLHTIFGIASNTYIGHIEDFHRGVHPEDRELVRRVLKDAMLDRKAYSAEFRILR